MAVEVAVLFDDGDFDDRVKVSKTALLSVLPSFNLFRPCVDGNFFQKKVNQPNPLSSIFLRVFFLTPLPLKCPIILRHLKVEHTRARSSDWQEKRLWALRRLSV